MHATGSCGEYGALIYFAKCEMAGTADEIVLGWYLPSPPRIRAASIVAAVVGAGILQNAKRRPFSGEICVLMPVNVLKRVHACGRRRWVPSPINYRGCHNRHSTVRSSPTPSVYRLHQLHRSDLFTFLSDFQFLARLLPICLIDIAFILCRKDQFQKIHSS